MQRLTDEQLEYFLTMKRETAEDFLLYTMAAELKAYRESAERIAERL